VHSSFTQISRVASIAYDGRIVVDEQHCAAARPQTMFETVLDGVFPFIKSLGSNGGDKVCAIRDSQTNNGV